MSSEGEDCKNRAGTNTILDTLAYLVDVGRRPIPYIFAGLVGGWLVTSEDLFTSDEAAFGMTALLAVSASLIFLPPLLALAQWSKKRKVRDHGNKWLISSTVGIVLLAMWAIFLDRLIA